jgi:MFS family permease
LTVAATPRAGIRRVITAAAAGTAFEWYDFFAFGALASVLASNFFAALPEQQAFVMTLATFAAGFIARPFGALIFGRIGDARGRKGAFLATIIIMGAATFIIGVLPTYDDIGVAAPAALVICRILQGFAIGGEYGGAAIFRRRTQRAGSPRPRHGLDTDLRRPGTDPGAKRYPGRAPYYRRRSRC